MSQEEEYIRLDRMSQTDSSGADDEYSSTCSDDTTYSDMEEHLSEILESLTCLRDGFEGINLFVKTLEEPVTDVLLEQMTDPNHLASSSFRTATFRLAVALPTLSLDRRYPYKDIVEKLRHYIFKEGLVDSYGQIRINQTLRSLFEFQESDANTTFPKLLQRLRHVLV